MIRVPPWVPVQPSTNPAAILGNLPFAKGSVTLAIPESVVPCDATGILVFAWAVLSGENPSRAYWHIASANADGSSGFFSLFVGGDPKGSSVTCNSQAFWLPPPVDGSLVVTLNLNDLPSGTNKGEVEIHGYIPGPATS
jgi:hypothetical protein